MITDEKKAVPFNPLLFYKALCNTTEFVSGQNKPNPILASSWFPAVVRLEKKNLFWPWNNLFFHVWVSKNANIRQ